MQGRQFRSCAHNPDAKNDEHVGDDASNGCDVLIQKSRLRPVSSGHVEVSLRGLPEAAPPAQHSKNRKLRG